MTHLTSPVPALTSVGIDFCLAATGVTATARRLHHLANGFCCLCVICVDAGALIGMLTEMVVLPAFVSRSTGYSATFRQFTEDNSEQSSSQAVLPGLHQAAGESLSC